MPKPGQKSSGRRLARRGHHDALQAGYRFVVLSVGSLVGILTTPPTVGVSSLWGPDAVTVVLAVLYLGLMSSAVATGIWTFLISQYGADRIAPLSTAVPVIGVAMGALVFHEPLGAEVLIAGAVMVVGLFLVTYQRRKRPNLLDTQEPAT